MSEGSAAVFYWDASAVLSALIRDRHSERATELARRPATHLLSTLAYAEVLAVVARLEREGNLPEVIAASTRQVLQAGPWRRLLLQPDWAALDSLSTRWPLRGADLWHLGAAVTLGRQLPELQLVTFDTRLAAAGEGAGLALRG